MIETRIKYYFAIIILLAVCQNSFCQGYNPNPKMLKARTDSNGITFYYYKDFLEGGFDGSNPEKLDQIKKLLNTCNASINIVTINPKEQYAVIEFQNPNADSYLYLDLLRESLLFNWINVVIPTTELNDDLFKEYYENKPLNKNDK